MKLFYVLLGAAAAIIVKTTIDRRRALEGAPPRRTPADRPLESAEDEITGPLSEV